jgi:chorismate lyase / 3-hydroxybenzoate synthase
MGSAIGLHLDYLSLAEFEAARWADVMGVATFDRSPPDLEVGVPVAQINTPVLGDAGALCEVWRTGHAVEPGTRGRVRYARTADTLFGCIAVTEDSPQDAASEDPSSETPLQHATEQAYHEILGTLDDLGYAHLIRVWNYVPEINRDTHGTERYRQFNSARQKALLASGRPVTGNVSAACALGAAVGSPLVVYFLASQRAPIFVENPRQVSAYHYPPQYGARSPVFSRATVLPEPGRMTLFISGTASIVGHQTIHVGDTAAQTRETLTNIEALLGEANRVTGRDEFKLDTLACKVYVRDPSDLPVIQAELRAALGPTARAVYLQADICRRDLSVEIEATAVVTYRSSDTTPDYTGPQAGARASQLRSRR